MPIKPNDVVLVDAQGNRRVFDRATEAPLAIRQGYRNETREEYESRIRSEALSSPVEQAKSFVAGAARGATFGISDIILSKADEAAREGLELRKEESPVASVAGELAGILVGSKVGAGKALATGAERLGARLTGGVANKIIQKTLRTAIAEGAEGAAYGLGQTISEEALDADPGINAERLVANVGIGSLLGGAGGGLFGLAGGVAGKAGAALRGGEKATGDDWMRAAIEKYTHSSAAKSLGAEPGAFKKLAKRSKTFEESVDELGEFLSKEKTADGKYLIERWDNPEKIYEKVRAYRSVLGDSMENFHQQLYQVSGDAPVSLGSFLSEAKQIIKKHENSFVPEVANRTKRLKSFVDNIEKERKITQAGTILDESGQPFIKAEDKMVKRKVTLKEVAELRREIDSVTFPKKQPGTGIVVASPMREDYLILARKLQNDIARHVETIAKKHGAAGEKIASKYRDLNKKFSFIQDAEAIGERGVMRGFSNRAFSPSDYVTAIGGSASGAAAFGPIGIPLGLGVGVVNKILRERSRATITAIGRWALTKESALSSAMRTQAKVRRAADGLMRAPRPRPGMLAGSAYAKATKEDRKDRVKEYRRVQDSVTRIAGNPSEMADELRRRTAQISDALPNLGQATQIKMTEVAQYLFDRMPSDIPMDPLRPGKDTAPPQQDIKRFMDLVAVASNPVSVLDRMAEGKIPTVDELAFLRACFPLVAQEITKALHEAISKNKNNLSYNQRLNIARVIGMQSKTRDIQGAEQQKAQAEEQREKDEFKLTASQSRSLGKSIESQSEGLVIN